MFTYGTNTTWILNNKWCFSTNPKQMDLYTQNSNSLNIHWTTIEPIQLGSKSNQYLVIGIQPRICNNITLQNLIQLGSFMNQLVINLTQAPRFANKVSIKQLSRSHWEPIINFHRDELQWSKQVIVAHQKHFHDNIPINQIGLSMQISPPINEDILTTEFMKNYIYMVCRHNGTYTGLQSALKCSTADLMLRQNLCIGEETTTPSGHFRCTPSWERKSILLQKPLWCQKWTPGKVSDAALRRLFTRTILLLKSADEAHGWRRKSCPIITREIPIPSCK